MDNIFTNSINGHISDHYSQFCISSLNKSVNNSQRQTNYLEIIQMFSNVKFNNELCQLDLNTVISSRNDPSKSFSIFYNKLQRRINKHAPLKHV